MITKIEIDFKNNISIKIEDYRKKTGATKTWIAEQIGMSKQSLSSLENSSNPTIVLLEKVAYVLKCDVKELYNIDIKTTNY
jgi:DNA-binding XRE family transcriptional regulator